MGEILIIGGTRFVGPPLISKLLANGNHITIFCRGSNYGYKPDPKIKIIKGDRENETDLQKIYPQKYDLVFDMCCYSRQHADDLLAALRGNFNHLVFFSTAAVYKKPLLLPLFENSKLGKWPSFGDYGTRKSQAEKAYIAFAEQNNKKLTIFRPVYLLGKDNYFDRENYYFSRILSNRPILIPGNGNALIQFAFLEETVEAFFVCSQKQKKQVEILNIGGDKYISLKNFVYLCGEIAGQKPKLIHLDMQENQLDEERFYDELYPFPNVSLILSNYKIKNNYNIEFTDLQKGLQEIYNHWRNNWNGKIMASKKEQELFRKLILKETT